MSSASKPIPDVSRQLARFAAEFQWENVPEHVRHEAKRSILNYFGTALSASYDSTIEKAVGVYGAFSNATQATIVGRSERMDILTAAAINTMAANVFDFDDTHIPTIIHPTAPVASPVFAWAQARNVTGVHLPEPPPFRPTSSDSMAWEELIEFYDRHALASIKARALTLWSPEGD